MSPHPQDLEALWISAEAASATGGKVTGEWRAKGVSIDSRTIQRGDLFVALKGPAHDGHDHVSTAFSSGAAAAMVDRAPAKADPHSPLIVVDDTFRGLNALARSARARSKARIVAVTGSVGKTGTKELIACALATGGTTVATAGNLNNHIGAPLSMARMQKSAAFGVFELGMSSSGEIAPLSRLVRPHVAVVTTVESVHTEFFDNLEGVADAKAEIFVGLEGDSVAVLNRDNRFFDRLAAKAREAGASRIVTFGESSDSDARLDEWTPSTTGGRVCAEIRGTRLDYLIGLSGRHWALNSVAALAAAEAAGIAPGAAAPAFAGLSAMKGRGARHRISLGQGTVDLIDETYNASPAAMRAAIQTLSDFVPGPGGRRIVVLGDMLELGVEASRLHRDLAAPLDRAGVDLVFTSGSLMAELHDALAPAKRGAHRASAAEIIEPVRTALHSGDVVLVKGSLGSRMAQVVDALLTVGGAQSRAASGT